MMTELRVARNSLLDGLLNSSPTRPFRKRRCLSDVSILVPPQPTETEIDVLGEVKRQFPNDLPYTSCLTTMKRRCHAY